MRDPGHAGSPEGPVEAPSTRREARTMSRWTRLLSGCTLVGAMLLAGSPEAAKLVVAGRDGGYGKALALAIGAYEAANPGVEIEQLALPYGGLYEKLVVNLREKAGGIDVVMLDDTWATEFMAKGWLAELGEADADFVAPAVAVSRYPYPDGTLYALPFVGNVELFAWRRDLFEKYGLAPPTTWTLAREAAAVIDEKEEGVDGVVFRGVKGNPIVTGFLPILWSFGGRIVDEQGRAALMSPESLEALEFWLSLKEYAPEGVETYNASEVRDALQQGRVAMSIELWPSWAPSLDDPAVSKVAGLVEINAAPGEKTGPAPML
ncbi:MAG TPA: extracellular solute-binding protein, partial [Rhodospirillales bacterium]|nr:extracellular solute-binding protein [Rhodospirillales bacterium]